MASGTIQRSGDCIASYYYLSGGSTYHLPKFASMGVLFVCTTSASDIYNMRAAHIESMKNLGHLTITYGTDTLDIYVNNSCTCIYLHD